LFLEYLVLEFLLIVAAGSSLFGVTIGIISSWLLLSVINIVHNYYAFQGIYFWELIISVYSLCGWTINYLLNRKTRNLRLVKVTAGSAVSVLAFGVFLPLIPGLIIWTLIVGIPLAFTYREIPKAFYLQLIFKFIFCSGWIIIGNILY